MEAKRSKGPSLGRRALAVVILAVGAWILLKIVIHVVAAVALSVAGVVAILAVIWAIRILF
jgi:hypothetical protein